MIRKLNIKAHELAQSLTRILLEFLLDKVLVPIWLLYHTECPTKSEWGCISLVQLLPIVTILLMSHHTNSHFTLKWATTLLFHTAMKLCSTPRVCLKY